MLVLIAGITGNLGHKLCRSLLSRGHQVRGLGRNPSKLPSELRSRLESFVQFSTYYDVPALDQACSSVDAVICAYGMDPILQLEGQLFLLRAAERARVERFVADSWNHDWRHSTLGAHESYDQYIAFWHQVEKTSDIKPVFIFNGIFAETLFSLEFHGHVGPEMPLIWDPKERRVRVWGTGHETWYWTTEQDAAEFTAEIVQRDDAKDGGCWNVCSGANSIRQVAAMYEEIKGTKVPIDIMGTVDELREKALTARREGSKRRWEHYIGWFYQLHTVDGTWVFQKLDNEKLNVQPTTLKQFLEKNPQI